MTYICKCAALCILILFAFRATIRATTIHVPADQPTIQAGIDAATPGDTVFVADGTYTGPGNRDIDFGGKGIVLKSENGAASTIIVCQGSLSDPHRGFYFHSGEDSTAVVEGFTIQGGSALYYGSGILCDSSSSPKILNSAISGNFALIAGGGIYCENSSPTIGNSTISENGAGFRGPGYGGGIYCLNSSPTITNSTISDNETYPGLEPDGPGYGGGIYLESSSPTIDSNNINGNYGAGIYCASSSPTINGNAISGNTGGVHCVNSNPTISSNTITGNFGGIFCWSSSPTISHNTISGNSGRGLFLGSNSSPLLEKTIIAFSRGLGFSPLTGKAVYCDDPNSTPTLVCCDVYGNEGGDWVGCIADQQGLNNNFSLDPLFCDTTNSDYHLDRYSPCLPQYNSCGELIGALSLGCDAGYVCADANGDSLINISDLTSVQEYYFQCAALPNPANLSDLNCDGFVNVRDIIHLAEYINGTGVLPCCVQ